MSAVPRIYSFDTSGLIDGIERFYPIGNFPGVWEHVDDLIAAGRLLVSEEAWAEALRADAPLKSWCLEPGMNREACIRETDAAVATIAGSITNDFPKWAQQGRKNGADPFVIAVAEVDACTVITGETNGGPGRPKIPYVCGQRNVDYGKFVDMVRYEGWVLHR
ncbi:DUF4411 family protein [Kineococcus aurantiacus]|uniref:DUF4411 family protein n=1 Tax=Kineococcus aurantiacus TaxID=37633 RepID=A0A7Y9ATR7_9ACTN|nr:hypothetical protein [Kineococcus aurantiacus]